MSLHRQPDTTHIQKLTVRGPQVSHSPLLSRLQTAHWPAPPDGSWVLVRKVFASASTGHLADELLDRTRRLVSAGGPSEVVRFPSLAALLAALIDDICQGVAKDRWYWQRWRRFWEQHPGHAVQQLVKQHPRQFTAICYQLAARSKLATLWQNLSPADAVEILYSMAHELSLPQGCLSEITPEETGSEPEIAVPLAQLKLWCPILAAWPPADPRTRLAALILASEYTALALQASPAKTLAAVQRALASAGGKTINDASPPFFRRPINPAVGVPETKKTGKPESSARVGNGLSVPGLDQHRPLIRASSETAAHQDEQFTSEAPATPASSHSDTLGSAPDSPPGQGADSNRVYTSMGGLLYLLNVLKRPPIQSLIEQAWQIAPNGWYWVYQLGCELDLAVDDALCEFLAERLGLESVAELASLPPLPHREDILSLIAQWLGPKDLWHPALIRVPAEFSYTPGHFDLYMDNSQVRMELRLAGLDFNPGWLPWLGTVVTFHFDHYPHLQGALS